MAVDLGTRTYQFVVAYIPSGYSEPTETSKHVEAWSFDEAVDRIEAEAWTWGEPLEIVFISPVTGREPVYTNRSYLDDDPLWD